MTNRHIKVQYHDGDNPVVYENDRVLTEKEIVDLLVEGFGDVDVLIKCLEEVRHTLVSLGGLEAFDGASERVVRAGNYKGDIHDLPEIYNKRVIVPLDEIIKLDFEDLINKIDEVIT